MSTQPIPREKIPWFPAIDEEKCIGCGECYEFCGNGVFEWDKKNDRPLVMKPFNCVVSCSACKSLCSQEAISFPTMEEIREVIKKYRKEQQKESSK